jgi:gamma-glutamylcyclotransferase (GGCT)/AIG2-like uncharacterized protein YtfP
LLFVTELKGIFLIEVALLNYLRMMNTTSLHLFVYGSLRSGFKNPAYEYLTRYFTYIGEALVKGQFYNAGTYPIAVSTNNEDMIVGELYTLKNEEEFSWAFEQLDDYEGINVEVGETPLYKRALVEVYQLDKIITAWVYWYNGNIDGLPKIDTGDLVQYLQQKIEP